MLQEWNPLYIPTFTFQCQIMAPIQRETHGEGLGDIGSGVGHTWYEPWTIPLAGVLAHITLSSQLL